MKKIDLIGVQMDLGAATRGVNMGPAAIRYAGVVQGIEALGYECEDKGDIIPPLKGATSEKLRNYEQKAKLGVSLHYSPPNDIILRNMRKTI